MIASCVGPVLNVQKKVFSFPTTRQSHPNISCVYSIAFSKSVTMATSTQATVATILPICTDHSAACTHDHIRYCQIAHSALF